MEANRSTRYALFALGAALDASQVGVEARQPPLVLDLDVAAIGRTRAGPHDHAILDRSDRRSRRGGDVDAAVQSSMALPGHAA